MLPRGAAPRPRVGAGRLRCQFLSLIPVKPEQLEQANEGFAEEGEAPQLILAHSLIVANVQVKGLDGVLGSPRTADALGEVAAGVARMVPTNWATM